MLGVYKLSDQERGGTVGNGYSEAKEETSSNKHAEVDTDTLKDDTQKPSAVLAAIKVRVRTFIHDKCANYNTHTTTENIGDIRSNGESNQGSNSHDAAEQTQKRAMGVTEIYQPCKFASHNYFISTTYNFAMVSNFADR